MSTSKEPARMVGNALCGVPSSPKEPGRRFLIVNADDLGQNAAVNRGVKEAHERGIVTSASLMVRWPAAVEAAALWRAASVSDRSEQRRLSLGLHVDLGEWRYRDEAWQEVYAVVPLDDRTAVAEELGRQLAAFRRLVGGDPTHIDSHQHVHRAEPVQSLLAAMARDLHVPLRHYSREVGYCGTFYGQTAKGEAFPEAISVDGLIQTLSALPPGFTELGCHPADGDDLQSMYGSQRAREVQTLCDPRVRAALLAEGIELRSFAALGKEAR